MYFAVRCLTGPTCSGRWGVCTVRCCLFYFLVNVQRISLRWRLAKKKGGNMQQQVQQIIKKKNREDNVVSLRYGSIGYWSIPAGRLVPVAQMKYVLSEAACAVCVCVYVCVRLCLYILLWSSCSGFVWVFNFLSFSFSFFFFNSQKHEANRTQAVILIQKKKKKLLWKNIQTLTCLITDTDKAQHASRCCCVERGEAHSDFALKATGFARRFK